MEREGAPPALSGTRVLVIDDEADARELLDAALTRYGADVRTAASAEEGIQLFPFWRPDVLVADIGMPVEDGYQLIRRVRALEGPQGGTIPAVAVTAYAQNDDRARALSAGYDEHLAKPVDLKRLASVVSALAGATSGVGKNSPARGDHAI